MTVRIELRDTMFGEMEQPLVEMGGFRVSTFRYSTGVAAVKLANGRGHLIILPFKGQQIWRCVMDGHDLSMKSMFDEPIETRNYLETYGAFFIHCGMSVMGVPGPDDKHPLHGEMPNAPFQKAWLICDEAKGLITVGGSYHYAVAFTVNYLATSTITLGENDALFDIHLNVENLKKSPMELMYLAHANFRPTDNGELIYSAPYTKESVRVRRSIPSHVKPKAGYKEFIEELAEHPERHHVLKPGLGFDPEIVFSIDMQADAHGFAHALLRRPNGAADYIRYRPDQAKKSIRWICRTGEQDAIGMAFPATAEPEGYTAEKAKGNIVELAGGATWTIDMRLGGLTAAETAALVKAIGKA